MFGTCLKIYQVVRAGKNGEKGLDASLTLHTERLSRWPVVNARGPYSYATRSAHVPISILKIPTVAVRAGQALGGDAVSHLYRLPDQLLYRRHRNTYLCGWRFGRRDVAGRPVYERLRDPGVLCGRCGARRLGPAPPFYAEHRRHAGNGRGNHRLWQRDRNGPCRRGALGFCYGVRPAHRHVLSGVSHRRPRRAQRHQLHHHHVLQREHHRRTHAGRLCCCGSIVTRGVRAHDTVHPARAHCRLGV